MMNHSRRNWIALGSAVIVSIIAIALMTVLIGKTFAGDLIIGELDSPVYPFTLQNIMHLFFFIGLGQLFVRWMHTYEENVFLKMSGFLPEENNAVLTNDEDIETISKNVANVEMRGDAYLPDLINTCIMQFLKSHSVSDTLAVLNSNLDLNIHRLDLRYSMIRYIVWVIPTFGFIGTVVGIAWGLGNMDIIKFMGSQQEKVVQFRALTSDLGFAFGTTIVALVLSAILVFLLHVVQKGEEEALNNAGKYVLTNFINRLSFNNLFKSNK
jgi:biopolymer transport protein ExbB/TolQ